MADSRRISYPPIRRRCTYNADTTGYFALLLFSVVLLALDYAVNQWLMSFERSPSRRVVFATPLFTTDTVVLLFCCFSSMAVAIG